MSAAYKCDICGSLTEKSYGRQYLQANTATSGVVNPKFAIEATNSGQLDICENCFHNCLALIRRLRETAIESLIREKTERGGERMHYESDDATFAADAYRVSGYRGIAWYVLGWETEPDEDTEWSGLESRTGNIVACMVGDDRYFSFEPDEITPLKREEYCGECGQIGCTCDGLDRAA